jgi:hypothetical protein
MPTSSSNSQSKSYRACRTGEEDGCSTRQRLSATPASNGDQSVVERQRSDYCLPRDQGTHSELKLERPAGAPYLGVEIPISSKMPTLLGRAPLLLVPLKLQPSKLAQRLYSPCRTSFLRKSITTLLTMRSTPSTMPKRQTSARQQVVAPPSP